MSIEGYGCKYCGKFIGYNALLSDFCSLSCSLRFYDDDEPTLTMEERDHNFYKSKEEALSIKRERKNVLHKTKAKRGL